MNATTTPDIHAAELTEALTSLDLSVLTKKQLVVLCFHLTGRKGDAARTPKETYLAQAAQASRDAVLTALRRMVDEGDIVFQYADGTMSDGSEPEDDDAEPAPAPAPAPAQRSKATPPASPEVNDVAAMLTALLSRGTVNPEQVRDIVADQLSEVLPAITERMEAKVAEAVAGIEPRIETRTIVVTPAGEPKQIDGLVHEKFERVVKLCGLRQNVLLVGPAGCGKTQLAAQVADALGLSFSFLSCSAGMSESQLQGWLLPIEDGGRFVYVPSAFVKAYEGGGVFLLDEIDAADENLLLVINSALANGYLSLPQRTDNPVAKRHADFVCIAAANTYGHGADRVYAGRNQLDGATLDRFRNGLVTMDYSEALEKELLTDEARTWGQALRQTINAHRLRRVVSTRVLIGYSQQQTQLGWGVSEWEESFFCDWTRDELAKVGR